MLTNSGLQVSKVLIILNDLNISNVYVSKTSHSKIKEFEAEVKVKAIKNAKQKAKDLLSAIGNTCGKTLFVSENQTPDYNNNMYMKSYAYEAVGDLASPETNYTQNISYQKIHLEYNIQAKFEILN